MSSEYNKELKISYKWNRNDDENLDCNSNNDGHGHLDMDLISVKECLDEDAYDRIFSQIKAGYLSGELHTSINGIEFSGWWDLESV